MQVNIPQLLNEDAFYAERDHRAALDHPVSRLAACRIAIAVPPDVVSANRGLEIALFWTASIIRRMGRPFAHVILVSTDEFRTSKSSLANAEASVEQVIHHELRSADPFAPVEWRTWTGATNLGDAATVVWLGTLPLGLRLPVPTLTINAHGWIAALHQPPDSELSLVPADFDAAPAAIVFASCMAAARIFADAFGSEPRSPEIVFALDSGRMCSNPHTCGSWITKGSSLPAALPWKEAIGPEPSLSRLLVVSAGGIGGNVCAILHDSYFRATSACVIDPDSFELSNLNRAIAVGLPHLGIPKANVAGGLLRECCAATAAEQVSYERWASEQKMAEYYQPGTAVIVGLDQVRSRLSVGSDWPWLVINGATSGTTFSAGAHVRGANGCIGCWYGQDEATYLATRTPMACAAGAAPGTVELRAVASYPFVSVAAAAQIVAMLLRSAHETNAWREYAGTVVSMSLRSPESAQVRTIPISDRCMLLCSAEYLQPILARTTDEVR